MTANSNLSHAECAARAETVTVRDYRIELDLRNAPDPDAATFPSRSTITFAATAGETWVDLLAERVAGASLNGRPVDVSRYDGARLPLTGLDAENELVVEAECAYSRTGEGLHRFTDPVDGATYLYTHFEPTDARRLYANFEQPDLKAEFTFVVTAPQDWRVLSGQREAERVAEGGVATVTFAPTPRLSTYITALAAGPYHRVETVWSTTRPDGSTQAVVLGALCRASMAEHLDAEAILTVTGQGMDFFDAAFGYPYPWGKYDQVFVPEYNIGAMENPGLVTFTEAYLHRGEPTRAQLQGRATTILHEMAHMWFGDLVTMRWWDGLWLKESFADLMGWHVAAAATEFDDAWTRFAGHRKPMAYRQDQLPTTHPVVARIEDLEAARQNFDGITYAKGASALKQLMAYVGEAQFFAGAREYFAEHAFGNTELADLLVPLERASGRDLASWSRVWLETAGISELVPVPEVGADGRLTRLLVRQVATDAMTGEVVDRPHRLVVGLYELQGGRLVRTAAPELDVTGAETEVAEAVGQRADLILVNDDDLTYAKVRLDPVSALATRDHLATIDSSLSRALLWSIGWNTVRDAVLPAREYVSGALPQLLAEPDAGILATALGEVQTAVELFLPAHERGSARAEVVRACEAGLAQAEPASDGQKVWARGLVRATAVCADGVGPVRRLLDGTGVPEGLEVDADLRWAALGALAAQDAVTVAALDEALAADDTMAGRTAYLRAVSGRPAPAARRRTWERAAADTTVTNDQLRALVAGFSEPSGAATTAAYVGPYFEALTGWWRERSMTMASILVSGLFPAADLAPGQEPEANPVLVRARQWLTDHGDAPPALRRIVIEQADHLRRALRVQAAAG